MSHTQKKNYPSKKKIAMDLQKTILAESLNYPKHCEIIVLGNEDQRVFVDALMNYEHPNEALLFAAKKYSELT